MSNNPTAQFGSKAVAGVQFIDHSTGQDLDEPRFWVVNFESGKPHFAEFGPEVLDDLFRFWGAWLDRRSGLSDDIDPENHELTRNS